MTRRRLVHRPPDRVGFGTGVALPHLVAGYRLLPGGLGVVLLLAGLGLLFAVWWPRLVVDADGIEVRNLRSTRVAWRHVADVRYEEQPPYRTALVRWLVAHNPRCQGAPPHGVVVRTAYGAQVGPWAAQAAALSEFVAAEQRAAVVARLLLRGVRAARRGEDAFAVVAAGLPRLRPLAVTVAAALPGLGLGWLLVRGL